MQRRGSGTGLLVIGLALGVGSPATAGFPKSPVTKCAPDAVVAGTVCMDKYEASVWTIDVSNQSLIKKVRQGKATLADLTAPGSLAIQRGVTSADYAPCENNGNSCYYTFAVSVPGVKPSTYLSWFQAQQACKSARKRLPSNAEWQATVAGTPDPGPDNGTTQCNSGTNMVTNTGSRSGCVSNDGAYDMVGNLYEWVADWVPESTDCPGWGVHSNDDMCLSGASTIEDGPGALLRGGFFNSGTVAGPLAVVGHVPPWNVGDETGFRCAR